MSATTLPITLGTASAKSVHAKDLGKVYWISGKGIRIVKAAAAIATAAKKILVSAVSAGAFTWAVNTSTTANDYNVVGIVPTGQTGSTGTTGLVSGDYFGIIVSGCTDVISAAAVAQGGLVGTSTTAGKADDATVAAGVGAVGVALESAGGADENMGVYMKGLV